MERKLIITRWKEQVLTSLLENGEIVEFHCSPNETKEQAVLGNIYVGKVKILFRISVRLSWKLPKV